MTEKEQKFLIEEYKTSWQMILNIDERRGKFIHYYSFVFVGVIGVAVNLLKDTNLICGAKKICSFNVITSSILLFGASIVGFIVVYMLIMERAANIRYRKKVNFIRWFMDLPDKYLNSKCSKALGIITLESEGQPKGVGKTLQGVLWFVVAEIVILLSSAVFLAYRACHILMFVEIVLTVAGLTYLLDVCLKRLCEAEKIAL